MDPQKGWTALRKMLWCIKQILLSSHSYWPKTSQLFLQSHQGSNVLIPTASTDYLLHILGSGIRGMLYGSCTHHLETTSGQSWYPGSYIPDKTQQGVGQESGQQGEVQSHQKEKCPVGTTQLHSSPASAVCWLAQSWRRDIFLWSAQRKSCISSFPLVHCHQTFSQTARKCFCIILHLQKPVASRGWSRDKPRAGVTWNTQQLPNNQIHKS